MASDKLDDLLVVRSPGKPARLRSSTPRPFPTAGSALPCTPRGEDFFRVGRRAPNSRSSSRCSAGRSSA